MTKRRAAFLAGKLLFAGIVIDWLFHKVDVSRVWNEVRQAALPPVIAGIFLTLATVAVAGWRWRRLLTIFGIDIPLGSLICIAQIGQFFTMFLPGPTGDDLTRMLYISRIAPVHVGEACATVLFDRLIGLAAVLALALFCIPLQWDLLSGTRQTHWLAGGMVIAGGIACILAAGFFLFRADRSHRLLGALLKLLPGAKLHDELVRMAGLLCANKAGIAQVIAAALSTQLLLCGAYCLAGVAVGIHAPLSIWFTFVPIVLAANACPITIAGIGVREYLLILFLRVLANIPSERAVAASFLAFGMAIAVCLVGGGAYIVYRPERQTPE